MRKITSHLGGGDGARLPRLAAILRLQQRLPAAQQEACGVSKICNLQRCN